MTKILSSNDDCADDQIVEASSKFFDTIDMVLMKLKGSATARIETQKYVAELNELKEEVQDIVDSPDLYVGSTVQANKTKDERLIASVPASAPSPVATTTFAPVCVCAVVFCRAFILRAWLCADFVYLSFAPIPIPSSSPVSASAAVYSPLSFVAPSSSLSGFEATSFAFSFVHVVTPVQLSNDHQEQSSFLGEEEQTEDDDYIDDPMDIDTNEEMTDWMDVDHPGELVDWMKIDQ
ncbi:uncharacterized protein BYT42DRAFT_613576 [Radiomyces spectabilis]|uniref:uncharacterized protein n=1 Tax=Radiomyces spectabilis TaxID=64574 RepID=UPI00221F8DF3|nr:uncharacterized protein BYT42DRAFT_613576 [Radiomyces spectabilis]KAI8379246.1 hypothetical protein BYT42DRAFT_613576 [Radiomyces spectabilis]